MKHEVVIRPKAEDDLLAIQSFLSESAGQAVAASVILRIQAACSRLALFPARGTPRPQLGAGIRSVALMRRVVIAYRITDVSVDILRIFYAGRDYNADDFLE